MLRRFFARPDKKRPLEVREAPAGADSIKVVSSSEGVGSSLKKRGEAMSDDLITADNLSKEFLKEVFDAAFMNTGYDDDGDLFVQERCKCFVFAGDDDKKKRVIRLRTYFRFSDSSSEAQRLTCVNEINGNYLFVRAVASNQLLMFAYDISLDAEMTKKAFVLLVKRFCIIPHDAVSDYGQDIVQ